MRTRPQPVSPGLVRAFFGNDDLLAYAVLRPLEHIREHWDLTWEHAEERYRPEEQSFAQLMNGVIDDLAQTAPPLKYHDNEDRLAEYVRDGHLKWPVKKVRGRWVGAHYRSILEQGGFSDADQKELVQAAAGRIWAAIRHSQMHFEEMEESHREMLGAVLSIILYHRS